MTRYKEFGYSQGKFIPIHFDKQILPGTFEYSLPIFDPAEEAIFKKVTFSISSLGKKRVLDHGE
jgi:hypothetical protein